MVQKRRVDDVKHASGGPAAGIGATINQPLYPRMHHRPRAHSARFKRHIEGCISKAIIGQLRSGRAQGDDLCMGGRVAGSNGPVPACAHNRITLNDNRAHRHFTMSFSLSSKRKRELHKIVIALIHAKYLIAPLAQP